jgi:hypothetical protein
MMNQSSLSLRVFSPAFLPVTLVALLAATSAHAQNFTNGATEFTPGDLVVSAYGVGGGYIDGVATPISLLEFTTTGTLVTTLTLPTTDNGTNYGIVGEYGSSSEANIQLTGDGQSLVIGGYQTDGANLGIGGNLSKPYSNLNGLALAQSFSIIGNSTYNTGVTSGELVPRVEAVVGANGVANTSTAFTGIIDQNNPRSVWSQNGTVLYVSGQGNSTFDQGIFKINEGTNITNGAPLPAGITPVSANSAISTRIVTAYNGNMYYSVDQKNAQTGIFEYSGIPTGTQVGNGTAITPANGTVGGNAVNFSPDGFYFANATTLYVADVGAPKNKGLGDGGIQKWTFNGSTWVLQYTLKPSNFIQSYSDKSGGINNSLTDGEIGFESITGEVVNGTAELFAVSYTIGDADQDGLYAISDLLSATNGTADSFTELQTAPGVGANSSNLSFEGGTVFKSVSFAPSISVPEPSTYALLFGAAAVGWTAWSRRKSKAA